MNELDIREQNNLDAAFELADHLLMKKYIANLSEYKIVPLTPELQRKNVSDFTRFFKIESMVYQKEENNLDKLSSVYNAIAGCGGSIVTLIESNGKEIDFYIGTKSDEISIAACQSILTKVLNGNFPGSNLVSLKNNELEHVMNRIFETEYEHSVKSISSVTGIAGIRTSLFQASTNGYVQGIEKLLDAMHGEVYTLMFIADPVSQLKMDDIREGYEALYSQLVPFATSELNFSANESDAVTESITSGLSKSISESLSKTQSHSQGSAKNYSTTKSTTVNSGLSIIIASAGTSKNSSRTEGGSESWNNTNSEAKTAGSTETTSDQKGRATTLTEGRSRSLQLKFENKTVQGLLGKIDEQLVRLNQCSDLGMWNCSAYVIAEDAQTSKVVASAFQSLMRGDNSSIESASLNTWNDNYKLTTVTSYLKKLHHPVIDININNKTGMPYVTPTSLLSGNELTIQAGLPQKSVPGLPVIEYASFGREVVSYQPTSRKGISIGNIYHMGKSEGMSVTLDLQSLASHTFITGSTGSGKSTLVYNMLTELNKQNIAFLVIEPVKGEYKHIFGHRSDVFVFGTNPAHTPLLKINPFKFADGTHVLEHIDRLVELFNVCWPMYAAMPAVLKDALEESYIAAGWDLTNSINETDQSIFPTFSDLLYELDQVISSSAYSEEVKSNYKGALFTRVKSLTNGLNGQIFCSGEIDNTILFDSNTIVDLSRIGSMETRSLLMGILVMRLQEHRMSSAGMNASLKHVTVLEEAHHLLKRTSTEQNLESANLLGKSVEMLTNSIAEMRTYGEGFIIADQSPGFLDKSVIRNTNTKIILRLPELSDRELVGYAASLDKEQISELAKLRTGIAAVYQNGWLTPILCNLSQAKFTESMYKAPTLLPKDKAEIDRKVEILTYILKDHLGERMDYNIDHLRECILLSSIPTRIKIDLLGHMINDSPIVFDDAKQIIKQIVSVEKSFKKSVHAVDVKEWNRSMLLSIDDSVKQLEPLFQNAVLQCIVSDHAKTDSEAESFYYNWVDYMKGRVQ